MTLLDMLVWIDHLRRRSPYLEAVLLDGEKASQRLAFAARLGLSA